MAVQLAGSATLKQTSGLFDYDAAYTVMGWFKLTDLTNGGFLFAAKLNDETGYDALYFDSTSDQIEILVRVPSGGPFTVNQDIATGVLTAGTWYPFAFVRYNSTDVLGWVNGTSTGVLSGGLGGRGAQQTFQLGEIQAFAYTGVTVFSEAIAEGDINGLTTELLKEVSGRSYFGAWPLVIATDYASRWGSGGATLTGAGTITTTHQPATMPHALYLPSSGDFTTFTPALDAEWDDSEDLDRITGTLVRGTTAFTDKTGDEANTTNNWDVCVRQYVYGPFTKAGTWDGRILGVIRCAESNTAANSQAQMIVRIMATDGTVRGTVVAAQTGTSNEWNTSLRSIIFPKGAAAASGAAVTSVDFEIGDYLIVELGSRNVNTSSTNRISTMNFGENSSTHLDFTELDTGADCPFILMSYPFDLAMGTVAGGTTVNTYYYRRNAQAAHFG
jgi:hypothetical protein